ncbi:MAG TPA: acetate--CoA ligase family protein [Usitatibacter sp.]|nr:acetate--CoA ligase family protein [Usitatibacter sp.]
MHAIFHPRSVAIVGASDDPAKTTGRPLRFLRQAGFAGAVYPVNPKRDTVLGERAWPSLAALPEAPEHAYIVTGTELALDAVEECGRRGVKVATVLAAGFSEAGEEGLRREERLRAIVAATGIRVIGPSSLGIVNVHAGMLLTANAAFAEPSMPKGSILVASHSGSMIGAIVSRGRARGIGFAGLVSVGNEVDLGIGEICAATLDDPQVAGYLLFLETIRHAGALRAFAHAAAQRGKAIVAYRVGQSAAAAELAVSHTGALAGEDDVADAFLRDCGIARVHTLDGLIEGLPLVQRIPIRDRGPSPKVGVVTTTGGGAAMVVDQLGVRGVTVEGPSPATLGRLAAANVVVAPGRIVDLTLAGTKYAVMKAALDVLLAAPEFDLVVAVPGSSARTEPELAVRPVIDSAGSAKPLAAFVVPDAPEALARFAQAGVPGFRTPEACADAIAAAFARRPPKTGDSPRTPEIGDSPRTPAQGRLLDELAAYALLARVGIRHAPAEALDAGAAASPPSIAYPVAVKVLSAQIPHKSDAGGVVLDVANDAQLREAIARIRARIPAGRVLVQAMVRGRGEALVGYRLDPQVGPIVILAAGGVLAEIHRDRSIRMAPVDIAEAREMVGEVKAFRALAGYRGRVPADLEALAGAVAALSRLALEEDPRVLDAEINPLVVLDVGRGVVAVDALVRLE